MTVDDDLPYAPSASRNRDPILAVLYLYGAYKIGGRHRAPSNAAFDSSLRRRNADWGLRDLDAVTAEAAANGFALAETVAMPANNLSMVFEKTA